MNIYNDIYISDLVKTLDSSDIWAEFRGKTFLITGAGGLICSVVADLLFLANEKYETDITVYLAGRSKERMDSRFIRYKDNVSYRFIEYDATKRNILPNDVDYIIHGASNAFPASFSESPVETMLCNFDGTRELLEYAKVYDVINTLYISSSEVYGVKNDDKSFTELDYGYMDVLNPRNAYGVSKRAAETLCSSYWKEYGVKSVIARPGHIFGPTASDRDNRVSSMFAFKAAKGEDIVLKSQGNQLRSYCYVLDAALAILHILLKGNPSEAYNIGYKDTAMTIKQMAECFAKSGGVNVLFDLPTDTEVKAFNPMDNSSLNADKLYGLGYENVFDAETGIEHTTSIIREYLGL